MAVGQFMKRAAERDYSKFWAEEGSFPWLFQQALPPITGRPISVRENYARCVRGEQPYWMPNYFLEKNILWPDAVEEHPVPEKNGFDWWGVDWYMEPGIGEIEGAELYTIDDFKLSGPSAATLQSMEQAEAIIQEEIDDFYVWYQGRALIPRIQEIKEDAVTDLNLRLHKILGKLPLSEQERKDLEASIDTAAGKVVTKMIFGLRDTLETDAFIDCVEGLEKVYEE